MSFSLRGKAMAGIKTTIIKHTYDNNRGHVETHVIYAAIMEWRVISLTLRWLIVDHSFLVVQRSQVECLHQVGDPGSQDSERKNLEVA